MAPPTYTSALVVGAGQGPSASLTRLLREEELAVPIAAPQGLRHSISISTTRSGEKIKVETKIFLPPDAEDRVRQGLHANTTQLFPVGPLGEIHKAAFDSAKHTIDVHIASQSAPRRALGRAS